MIDLQVVIATKTLNQKNCYLFLFELFVNLDELRLFRVKYVL